MAGNSIKVSTQQVADIANRIEKLNKDLAQNLRDSKSAVDNLSNVWQGQASSETIAAFDSFAAKYFQSYEDTIQQYVNFLRKNVETGYTDTENANVKLSQAFK